MSNSLHGTFGRYAAIDLTTGDVRVLPLAPELTADYLGGRGLATRLLYDAIDPACDPLGPDNAVVIAASPLIGTNAPTAARGHMVFKSPLTGVIGTANSGGGWGHTFKAAGLDALVVKGRAASPVWIDISPAGIKVRAGPPSLGPRHSRRQRRADRGLRGRRPAARPVHRAGGGEPGPLRRGRQRQEPRLRPLRRGGRLGLQEPQGHPGARPGKDRPLRQGALPVRLRSGFLPAAPGPGDQAADARAGHGRAGRADQRHRHAAPSQLPGLHARRGPARPRLGRDDRQDHPGAGGGVLSLPDRLPAAYPDRGPRR